MTLDDIRKTIERVDRMNRPYVVFCNPNVKDMLEKEIGHKYKVEDSPHVSENQIIIIDRERLDSWKYGGITKGNIV